VIATGAPQDLMATLDCLYGEPLDYTTDFLYLRSIGQEIEFVDCNATVGEPGEGGGGTDPLAEPLCQCEQSTYFAGLNEFNCDELEIIYFYHPDYLGSTEFITDMRGEPYQFFLNTPWGENLENQYAKSYTSFSSRFRFNGKEWDEETGNFYYGARYYDPKVSVWLSVDPLASKYPNSSPYVFVANNPINLIDPDGMKWVNAHDDDVAAAQANYDSKETGLGRFFAGMKLNSAKKAQGRVDNALQELKAGDEDLYNYVDNLQVSDNNGNTGDVNVSVSSDGRSEGLGGQKAQTAYLTNGTPSANYKGGKIALPIRPGSTDIGFNVSLYGAESFMDVSLSNEAGDIMFFMEYNAEAVSSGGDAKFFKPGGGGYDAYVKSPQGSYSFKVQNLYRERKNMDKKSNVWPLKR